jgi:hypothetical protein
MVNLWPVALATRLAVFGWSNASGFFEPGNVRLGSPELTANSVRERRAGMMATRISALGLDAAVVVTFLMTAPANAHAGTTYGNLSSRWFLATDGFSPYGTAVPATRDSITSGALSANVRPLRVAKPYIAGVPTT